MSFFKNVRAVLKPRTQLIRTTLYPAQQYSTKSLQAFSENSPGLNPCAPCLLGFVWVHVCTPNAYTPTTHPSTRPLFCPLLRHGNVFVSALQCCFYMLRISTNTQLKMGSHPHDLSCLQETNAGEELREVGLVKNEAQLP